MAEHKHSGVQDYINLERAGVVDAASRSGNGIYPKTTQEGKPQPPVIPQPAVPTTPDGKRPVDGSGRTIVPAPIAGLFASVTMKDLEGKP